MSGEPGASGRHSRDLHAVFEIEPAASAGCPLIGAGGEMAVVRQQLVDGECHSDATVEPPEREGGRTEGAAPVEHVQSEVGPTCPCARFLECDCVPQLASVDDDRLRLETYVADHGRLTDLVMRLVATVDGLRLCRLHRTGDEAHAAEQRVTVDLAEVGRPKIEAVTKAVEAGYYASPRATSLADLAEDLGVTRPVLADRLAAVEAKLVTTAFAPANASD